MYNALTHLWYNSEVVYTSLLRVLCTITLVDVFNRLIKLDILFPIHVDVLEQLSTTALANIKLALHRVYADYVKFWNNETRHGLQRTQIQVTNILDRNIYSKWSLDHLRRRRSTNFGMLNLNKASRKPGDRRHFLPVHVALWNYP